jgi:hypothetical protein
LNEKENSVRNQLVAVAAAVILGASIVPQAAAQGVAQPSKMLAGGGNVPLEVQIVISRYQGEKRVSSMPYTLSLRSGAGKSSLRLGARVPMPSPAFAPSSDKDVVVTPLTTFNYENVGINIDCQATAQDNGGFDLHIEVNESSAVTDERELRNITGGNRPVFRSYQSTNTLFMRDGQTSQFTAATDRVTGEVVRVEVKLTVLK